MTPGGKLKRIALLRELIVVKATAVRADKVSVERAEIRKYVSRLRARVEFHKGGSVLDLVLDFIDGRR